MSVANRIGKAFYTSKLALRLKRLRQERLSKGLKPLYDFLDSVQVRLHLEAGLLEGIFITSQPHKIPGFFKQRHCLYEIQPRLF